MEPIHLQSPDDIRELRFIFSEICRKNIEDASNTMSTQRLSIVSFRRSCFRLNLLFFKLLNTKQTFFFSSILVFSFVPN